MKSNVLKNGFLFFLILILFQGVSAQSFTESGGQESFTTQNYNVSTESARSGVDWLELNGSVSGLSNVNESVSFGFEYRTKGSSTWNEAYAGDLDSSGNFDARVENLNPDTNYEFRAVSLENDKSGTIMTKLTLPGVFTKSGGSVSFTTNDYSVSTLGVQSGVDWLRMNGSVNNFSNVNESVSFGFEYRTKGSSTWNEAYAGDLDSSGNFDARVENLNPDTNYEFRAVSLENDKSGTIMTKLTLPGVFTKSGGQVSFQTKNYGISTVSVESGVDWLNFRGELSGIDSELRDPIALYFEYRTKGSSTWNSVIATSRTNNGFFEERVEGLQKGTVYEFRAYSENDVQGSVLEKQTLPGVFTVSGGVVSFATGSVFNVTISDINAPVFEGGDVEVEALVENEGASGDGYVNLTVPGIGEDSEYLSLNDGESTYVNLNVSTTEGDSGNYTANVSSSGDEDLQDFTVTSLEPPYSPQPVDGEDPVGLDWDLSAKANATGDVNMTVEYYLNESTDTLVGSRTDVSTGERTNVSLSNVDLTTGTTYDWYALADVPDDRVYSDNWNFTTVEMPKNTSIEPFDGEGGVKANSTINVTVDGSANINVSIYNYEGDVLMHEETVSPGATVSYDTSNSDDFGSELTNRWYVKLESLGAEWNNSENPYEFSVSDIESVNYSLQNFESGQNLNPGSFGGLEVIGPQQIEFEVSNPQNAGGMDFRFNLSNGTASDTYMVNDIENQGYISANVVDDFNVNITENKGGYEIYAYYLEGQTEYKGDSFSSNITEFSTYVSKINWTHTGEDVQEFRIYYNSSYVQPEDFTYVDSVGSNVREAGVANRRLQSNSENDCYQVEAWNPFGGSFGQLENPEDNCLGSGEP